MSYEKEVRKNLEWALSVYKLNDKITTTIFRGCKAIDLYYFSADSLPWLLYCLDKTQSHDLILKYKDFLNSEIKKYFHEVFDEKTKLVRRDKYFSTPKDVIERKMTCVSNTFMIFLKNLLDKIKILENPFKDIDLINPFINAFWNGKFFRNDIEDPFEFISSDANVWPYWINVITDEKMLKKSIDSIKQEKLDEPFPIKYHSFLNLKWMHPLAKIFTPNYQGNSIWALHTPIYMELESRFYKNDAKKHLQKYLENIEKFKGLVELYEPDGLLPLKGRFGHRASNTMLWASNIPRLAKLLS